MAKPQCEDGYTRIANELLEALSKTALSTNEWKVLLVIMRQTYGFKRRSTRVKGSVFVEGTGLVKQSVSRALRGLLEKNMILKHEDRTTEINKDYDSWQKVNDTVYKNLPVKVNNTVNFSKRDCLLLLTESLTRVNGTVNSSIKENFKENIKDKLNLAAVNDTVNSAHQSVISYFYVLHDAMFGFDYDFNGKKDGEHIKQLLEKYGPTGVMILMNELFLQDKSFFDTKTIGKLYGSRNDLAQLARMRYKEQSDIQEWLNE